MLDIAFTVYDEPSAMPRPRVAVIAGRPRVYVPTTMKERRHRIRVTALDTMKQNMQILSLADGPVALQVDAFFTPPKSLPKRDLGVKRKTSKPDLNNCVALVCDALTGIVWRDDAQVVLCRAQKHYAWDGERPRWEIRVRSADVAPS